MDRIPAIIVDIDGTIADCSHRLRFIQGEKKDWDGFYQHLSEDKPKRDIIQLIAMVEYDRAYHIIYVTGRSDRYSGVTHNWVRNNRMFSRENFSLFMRKEGDFRQDFEIKKEIYENEIKDKYDVKYVFEDRDQVVKMYRELGLTVLQVANGDF